MQIATLPSSNHTSGISNSAKGIARNKDHAACPVTGWHLSVITKRTEFDALEEQWNALFERAGRPDQLFQSFHWLWHWANHYLDGNNELSIVAGFKQDRLVMAWPMIVTRVAGIRKLTWMGDPVSPYGDVLVENGLDSLALLREGWAKIRSLQIDVVSLPGIRRDASIAAILSEIRPIPAASMAAPFLHFANTNDFKVYQQRYSAKAMSDRRRRMRRLREAGSILFEQQTHGLMARDLIDRAFLLKRTWLEERGIISRSLYDPRINRFFGDLVLGQTHPVGARVSAVRCNGEPIAIEVSFACKKRVFGHVIAYDTAFRKQGVGVVLADYSIGTACEQGFAMFDLLPPGNALKAELADGTVPVQDWAVPLTRKGKIYTHFWLSFAYHWLKKTIVRMPIGFRRKLLAIYRRSLVTTIVCHGRLRSPIEGRA